jgi:hypothetical protein
MGAAASMRCIDGPSGILISVEHDDPRRSA